MAAVELPQSMRIEGLLNLANTNGSLLERGNTSEHIIF